MSELKVYPVGTPVSEITSFDRSRKVVFGCADHPESQTYMSKDPHVSNWFRAGYDGTDTECECEDTDSKLVLVLRQEYRPYSD